MSRFRRAWRRLGNTPWVSVVLATIVILLGLVMSRSLPQLHQADLTIAGSRVTVERAETPEEQERGLAGRLCLLTDQRGMYFPFAAPRIAAFWMKGMFFPLDIIWVHNGRVVGWEASVPPDHGQRIYRSPDGVDGVVEVHAGWAIRHNLHIGDQVEQI